MHLLIGLAIVVGLVVAACNSKAAAATIGICLFIPVAFVAFFLYVEEGRDRASKEANFCNANPNAGKCANYFKAKAQDEAKQQAYCNGEGVSYYGSVKACNENATQRDIDANWKIVTRPTPVVRKIVQEAITPSTQQTYTPCVYDLTIGACK